METIERVNINLRLNIIASGGTRPRARARPGAQSSPEKAESTSAGQKQSILIWVTHAYTSMCVCACVLSLLLSLHRLANKPRREGSGGRGLDGNLVNKSPMTIFRCPSCSPRKAHAPLAIIKWTLTGIA